MNETWLGTIPLIGWVILGVACWFYMWGGRSGKWKRRFIGSCLCSVAIWLTWFLVNKFTFWLLSIYPLTIGAFCLGYGADIEWVKWRKRLTVVLASLVTGLILAFLAGGDKVIWLFSIELIIASLSSVLGVKNPLQAAPEEFFVCALLWMPKLMYAFV